MNKNIIMATTYGWKGTYRFKMGKSTYISKLRPKINFLCCLLFTSMVKYHVLAMPLLPWHTFQSTRFDDLLTLSQWINYEFSLMSNSHNKKDFKIAPAHSDSIFSYLEMETHWESIENMKKYLRQEDQECLEKIYISRYGLNLIFKEPPGWFFSKNCDSIFMNIFDKYMENNIKLEPAFHSFPPVVLLRIILAEENQIEKIINLSLNREGDFYTLKNNAFNFLGKMWQEFYAPSLIVLSSNFSDNIETEAQFRNIVNIVYYLGCLYIILNSYKFLRAILEILSWSTQKFIISFENKFSWWKKNLVGLHKDFLKWLSAINENLSPAATSPDKLIEINQAYGIPDNITQILNITRHFIENHRNIQLFKIGSNSKYVINGLKESLKKNRSDFADAVKLFLSKFTDACNNWYIIHTNTVNTNRFMVTVLLALLSLIFGRLLV